MIAEFGMRPEPRWVQGSPVLHVVQGGMKKNVARYTLLVTGERIRTEGEEENVIRYLVNRSALRALRRPSAALRNKTRTFHRPGASNE